MSDIFKKIAPMCFGEATPVGSRVTCSPAPEGTDADYIVLVKETHKKGFIRTLESNGFEFGGSKPDNLVDEDTEFQSFTKDEVNIIATCSMVFHHRFLAASSVAKRLNLLRKDDRIALFQAVLYGNIDSNDMCMDILF